MNACERKGQLEAEKKGHAGRSEAKVVENGEGGNKPGDLGSKKIGAGRKITHPGTF